MPARQSDPRAQEEPGAAAPDPQFRGIESAGVTSSDLESGRPARRQNSTQTPPATTGPGTFLPAISPPKGTGTLKGLGEVFSTNLSTGTASLTVPLATSPGRDGFELGLQLTYDSGAGNSVFGIGWSISVPSITRKTDKGIPRYQPDDTFMLAGAEDLVPAPPPG